MINLSSSPLDMIFDKQNFLNIATHFWKQEKGKERENENKDIYIWFLELIHRDQGKERN